MAIRVKLRIKGPRKEVKSIALVNSGFEVNKPKLLIPIKLAEKLDLYPPKKESKLRELEVAGGEIIQLIEIENIVKVRVVTSDKEGKETSATALISPKEKEVLISDLLTDKLGIILLKPGSGIWRFIDDPPNMERKSEK